MDLCIALLGSKCSKYSPLAVTLREYAFPLLRGLSLHAIGVTALSEDISEAISVLIHHLGMIVLGDTKPALTSSPEHVFSTDVIGIQTGVLLSLSPYLTDYFCWLLNHKKPFVKICRALEVVEYIHPALRKSLQNEDFHSKTDLMHKYEGKYKRHLTLMPLPIQLIQREDVVQVHEMFSDVNFGSLLVLYKCVSLTYPPFFTLIHAPCRPRKTSSEKTSF